MEKYLLALDGSETSAKAAERALHLAKKMSAKIDLITVISNKGLPTALEYPKIADSVMVVREEEAKKIAVDGKKYFKDNYIDVETFIVTGDPGNGICNFAADNNYDMVIIGPRGHGGIKRIVLGSVAIEVVQCEEVSLLIIK